MTDQTNGGFDDIKVIQNETESKLLILTRTVVNEYSLQLAIAVNPTL